MTEESRATDIVERPLQPATDVARRLEMRVLALRSRTRQTAEIKYDVGLSEEAADEIASLRSELESARERADNMQAELEKVRAESFRECAAICDAAHLAWKETADRSAGLGHAQSAGWVVDATARAETSARLAADIRRALSTESKEERK